MKKTTRPCLAATLLALTLTPALAEDYQASTADKPLNIVNLEELEAEAQKSMSAGAFGYVRGGAENEQSLRENTSSFDKKYIEPRILAGLETADIDMTTELFGIPLTVPVIQAPMAAHGLAHVDGEEATPQREGHSGKQTADSRRLQIKTALLKYKSRPDDRAAFLRAGHAKYVMHDKKPARASQNAERPPATPPSDPKK